MITGNYTIKPNPEWKNVQNQEVYLVCDTTLGAVNITLPTIASLGGFQNVKFYISDGANNAATNNITILKQGTDVIDATSSVVINADGGAAEVMGFGLVRCRLARA